MAGSLTFVRALMRCPRCAHVFPGAVCPQDPEHSDDVCPSCYETARPLPRWAVYLKEVS